MEKYQKVLDLMRSKGGRVELSDPDLLAILERDAKGKTNLVYRISAYMYSIRHVANLQVRSVRNSRKVVAYELVAATPGTPAVVTEQDSGSVSGSALSDGTVVETPEESSHDKDCHCDPLVDSTCPIVKTDEPAQTPVAPDTTPDETPAPSSWSV